MATWDRHKKQAARLREYNRRRGIEAPAATVGRGPGTHTTRFLAIDGEGGNVNGRHEYTLLVAAGKGYAENIHNSGNPLRAAQCLDFIIGLPKQRALISFYFNYDITMMLRELDLDTLQTLVNRDARTMRNGKVMPALWRDYALDWIPGKLFKVQKGKHSRIVYDTSGFFQSSLVQALEGWGVGDSAEKDFVIGMKADRSEFTGEVTPAVIEYATTECVLLCKLMDLVYRESKGLGFELRTYSGAGSLANAMLEKWGVGEMVGSPPEPVVNAAWHAYFGGRFETAAVGEVPGPVYEYDINSAYPYAMQNLPCLECGEWLDGEVPVFAKGVLTLHHVRWTIPTPTEYFERSAQWGPFPWRHERGGISYPFSGEGWYWFPEYDAAMRSRYAPYIDELERWTYIPNCEHSPFGNVPTLYEHRKELKAEGHLGERVIKLGINSLYGKTAQSVGARKFASPIWAGWITSSTRAMCFDATQTPEGYGNEQVPNVLMIATDAVYSRVPLSLPLGNELGDWEYHTYDNLLIVQPGLYALNVDTDKAEIRKTRGIRKTSFTASDVLALWREHGIAGGFEAPRHSFIGLRRGLVSRELEPGQWVDETRYVSFKPSPTKRVPESPILDKGALFLQCLPVEGEPTMSAIYSAGWLSEEWAQVQLMTADDWATPGPEENPGVIPGFARSDIPTEN